MPMRAISYREIERRAACLFTGEEELSESDANLFNVWINQRASEFWERFFFPELTVVEERTFRAAFDPSATYAATNEVYYRRVKGYFQALRNPKVANTVTNVAGLTAQLTLATAHGLASGRTLYITVSGIAGGFNGTWLATASGTNVVSYTLAGAPGAGPYATGLVMIHPAGADGEEISSFWAACASGYDEDEWAAATVYAVGTKVYDPMAARYKQVHTAHTSGGAIDDTKFGLLTNFVRSIDFEQLLADGSPLTPIGNVRTCYEQDPRTTENASQAKFVLLDGFINVRGEAKVIWVEFRKRVPSWSGAAWAAATIYAEDGQAWDETTGDFYRSLVDANTGNAVTDATKWEPIRFPYIFRDCVPQAALSSALRSDQEQEKSVTELAEANRLLKLQIDIVERQEGQSTQMKVRQR